METIFGLLSVYPISLYFLFIVALCSVNHLMENHKFLDGRYGLIMWVSVPITTISLFSVIYCFYVEKYLAISMGTFAALVYLSSILKSSVKRSKTADDEGRITEVLYRLTPEYPGESDISKVQCWHLSLDILALIGLWFFILVESWMLPWIVAMIHTTYI